MTVTVLDIMHGDKHYKAYCDGPNIRIAKQCHKINVHTGKPIDYEHTMNSPDSSRYIALRRKAIQMLKQDNGGVCEVAEITPRQRPKDRCANLRATSGFSNRDQKSQRPVTLAGPRFR